MNTNGKKFVSTFKKGKKSLIITTYKNENNHELFDLNAGITKLRIYFWLEGQDVDCENNASLGDLSITLKLSTNPA